MSKLLVRLFIQSLKMIQIESEIHNLQIISRLIQPVFSRLTKQDLLYLGGLIVAIFETEAIGTFYSPSKKGDAPTGKLFSSYSNLRNALASVRLITRESRKSQGNVTILETVEIVTEPDVEEAMKILEKDKFENLEEISSAWSRTSEARDSILTSDISTSDYLRKFPIMKDVQGVELVSFLVSFST